jgi:hypothetical protein
MTTGHGAGEEATIGSGGSDGSAAGVCSEAEEWVVGAWRRRGEVVEAVRVGLASWAASPDARLNSSSLVEAVRVGRPPHSMHARMLESLFPVPNPAAGIIEFLIDLCCSTFDLLLSSIFLILWS